METCENTLKEDVSMELSDEDMMTDFELRCAMETAEQQSDVEQEFAMFEEKYLNRKSARALYIKYVAAAVAACIAVLIVFALKGTGNPEPELSELRVADDRGYVSPPPMKGVELIVGKRAVDVGSKGAEKKGVVITRDSVIHFLSPENVAPEDRNIITIPQGKVAHIELPDGSHVSLSARSRLIFPQRFLPGRNREVRLIGEGYFDVARDESRPFIVHSGEVSTRVLGTQFNIRSFEGEPSIVTLVSGSVTVEKHADESNGREVTLKPGQQAVYDPLSSNMLVCTANFNEALGWKDGLFCFGKHSLKVVLVEIARWYNLNVRFENVAHLNDFVHYNGERSWSVRQVVDQLNEISNVNISLLENTLVVK